MVIVAVFVDSYSNVTPAGRLDIDCVPIGAVIATVVGVLREESTSKALVAHKLRGVYLLVLIRLLTATTSHVGINRTQYVRQLLNVVQVRNISHGLCGLLLDIILSSSS